MTSGGTSRQPDLAERARRLRNTALASVLAVFAVVAVLAMTGVNPDGDLAGVWIVLGTAGLVVACGAQLVRLVAQFRDGMWEPGDRHLPRAGGWARLVCRGSGAVAATSYLAVAAITFPVAPSETHPGIDSMQSAVTELVEGYREPGRHPNRSQ